MPELLRCPGCGLTYLSTAGKASCGSCGCLLVEYFDERGVGDA